MGKRVSIKCPHCGSTSFPSPESWKVVRRDGTIAPRHLCQECGRSFVTPKLKIRRGLSEEEILLLKELITTKTFPEISKIMGRSAANLNWYATTKLKLHRTNFRDYSGQKFGKITVVKFLHYNNLRKSVWECKCDCGKVLNIVVSNLISGAQVSCGCIRRNKQYESIENFAFNTHKRGARKRNFESDLTREQYLEIAYQPCTYCKRFSIRENKATKVTLELNSVDRIDNEPFYRISNCQSVCFVCQRMKSDMTHSEFRKHMKGLK